MTVTNHEHTNQVPEIESLSGGLSTWIETNGDIGDVTLVAGKVETEEKNRFNLVDLRPFGAAGRPRQYGDSLYAPDVDFLLLQDNGDGKPGYKGIRAGERIVIGREDPMTSSRFKLPDTVSRQHMSVEYVPNEGLLVTDLNAANGTNVIRQDAQSRDLTLDRTTPDKNDKYETARTLDQVKILSDTYIDGLRDIPEGVNQRTAEILNIEKFKPVVGVEIDGMNFSFSPVLRDDSENRQYAYGYADDKMGTIMPRLFYRSHSDGGWRVTPGLVGDHFSKGNFEGDEFGQYSQATKPKESISAVLDELTNRGNENPDAVQPICFNDDIAEDFSYSAARSGNKETYEDQTRLVRVEAEGLDAFVPGVGYVDYFSVEEDRKKLESIVLPEGFEPDFSEDPLKKYKIDHTLLGDADVDVFGAQLEGRPVEWHVAHDSDGRIWIERLRFKDGGTTDFGTESELIVAGALNLKPLDYRRQLGYSQPDQDYDIFDRRYADLRKTIDRMPWAKRFRAHNGIY